MNSLTCALLLCAVLALGDPHLVFGQTAGSHLWSKRFGSSSVDRGRAVATDGSGNLIVTGCLSGTVDFGGGPLTSAGGCDIFVAKFSGTDGAHLWSKRFGSSSSDEGHSVAVDEGGDVVVTGSFQGTVDFGSGPLTSAGFPDIFLLKLSGTNGTQLWSKRFGGGNDDLGRGVTVDGSGNVLLIGEIRNTTVDFGGGPLTTAGGSDVFVAKFSGQDGSHLWSKRFGGVTNDTGWAVAVDNGDDVIVTGRFSSTVDFGGGPLTSAGLFDIFVLKLSAASGAHLWSRRFGGEPNDFGNALAISPSGNVFLTGCISGTVDFGGGPLTSAGECDIFVAKFAATDGSHLWSKRFGSSSPDEGYSVAADEGGDVVVTGFFHGTVDFGGGPLTSAGGSDIFVAKFSGQDGSHRWSKRFGDAAEDVGFPPEDTGYGVSIDGSSNATVIGSFQGMVDFGGGPLTSAGDADIFVLRLQGIGGRKRLVQVTSE